VGASTKTMEIEEAMERMPIFPLPQIVLFPQALLPLHIFEPRYRALLKDCLASHRTMALALLGPDIPTETSDAEPPVSERRLPPIAAIAGVGVIVEHQALPDGRANIVLQGRARVQLDELRFEPPYRRARATLLRDTSDSVPSSEVAALVASVTGFAAEIRKHNPTFSFRVPGSLEGSIDAGVLSDYVAHHFIVDTSLRQRLLEELSPKERIRLVTRELAAQHSALLRESGGLLH
jgi:Lon protease-like protein